jgi:hypothetical protein
METDTAPSPEEIFQDTASQDTSTPDTPSSSDAGFLEGLFGAIDGQTDEPAPQDTKPATEPPDEDLADLPPTASEKTKADWKTLKGVKKQIERERDELKRELETLKAQPKSTANEDEIARIKAELEDYKTKYEDYDKKVTLLDVKQSREYQENIAQPLARAESIIQDFATKYELSIPEIAKAAMHQNLLERNSMLAQMVTGMNDFDKFEFKRVVDDAQMLFQRAQQVEQNASAARKYAEEQTRKQQEEMTAQQKAAFDSAADKVWQNMTKRMSFITEDATAAEKMARDAREADLASASPEVQAYARYASVLLPNVLERFEKQQARIKELEDSIAKRNGAAPRARSGSVPTSEPDSSADFMSGLDAVLGRV